MKKKHQKTITVYELDGGFFVEVGKQDDSVDFYLCHRNYGVKLLMFGYCDFYGMTEEDLILENVDEFIAFYKAEHFDYIDLEVA